MQGIKGKATFTVVVLLCTVMFSLLFLGPVSAAPPSYDMTISFLSPNGTCVADAFGLTYTVLGESFGDPTVYGEAYWGTYLLYLPGQIANIRVAVTYVGGKGQVSLKLATETYSMNTDGSNGELVNAQNIEFTAVDNVPTYVDAPFTLPMVPKGLYRVTAKLYSAPKSAKKAVGTLMKTTEAIFCPPPAL